MECLQNRNRDLREAYVAGLTAAQEFFREKLAKVYADGIDKHLKTDIHIEHPSTFSSDAAIEAVELAADHYIDKVLTTQKWQLNLEVPYQDAELDRAWLAGWDRVLWTTLIDVLEAVDEPAASIGTEVHELQ